MLNKISEKYNKSAQAYIEMMAELYSKIYAVPNRNVLKKELSIII